jgi:hypothetical protein
MAESTAGWHFQESRPTSPTSAAPEARRRLRRIERLAWILDRSIPLGKWRIGLDPLLGLMPGWGDGLGAVLSLYVLYESARLGVRGGVLSRMAGNILLETIIGAVPVVGDLFDFAWRANTRNIALLHRHYDPNRTPRSVGWVWAVVGLVALGVIALIAVLAYLVLQGIERLLAG